MTLEEIREKVQDILRMIMKDNSLLAVDELSAKEVEAWDSLNHINLIVTIEAEFGVRFSNEAISELENLGQLLSFIHDQLGQQK